MLYLCVTYLVLTEVKCTRVRVYGCEFTNNNIKIDHTQYRLTNTHTQNQNRHIFKIIYVFEYRDILNLS